MTHTVNIINIIAAILLGAAIVICLSKALFSSQLMVRLVALDVFSNTLIAVIALWALAQKKGFLFDIAIAITLVMFLATIAYSQFIVKRREST